MYSSTSKATLCEYNFIPFASQKRFLCLWHARAQTPTQNSPPIPHSGKSQRHKSQPYTSHSPPLSPHLQPVPVTVTPHFPHYPRTITPPPRKQGKEPQSLMVERKRRRRGARASLLGGRKRRSVRYPDLYILRSCTL